MNTETISLAAAREVLNDVARRHDVLVGTSTRGKFGGDVLLLSVAFRPRDYTVTWFDGGGIKPPEEAARLVRGYAKRKHLSIETAASRWLEARGDSDTSIVDCAIVNPFGASRDELTRWQTVEAQSALVDEAAAEGVTVELGRYGEDGYELADSVPVVTLGATGVVLDAYRRQLLAALNGDEK